MAVDWTLNVTTIAGGLISGLLDVLQDLARMAGRAEAESKRQQKG